MMSGKSFYKAVVGRNAKALGRSIVKKRILISKINVFALLSVWAVAEAESTIPNELNASSVCDLADEQVDGMCLRHEVKSEKAPSWRICNTFEDIHLSYEARVEPVGIGPHLRIWYGYVCV